MSDKENTELTEKKQTAKVNDILTTTLLHYINLEYYANELDEEFQDILSELQARCLKAILSQTTLNTKFIYTMIMKVIKEEVEKFKKILEERLDEVAEQVLYTELDWLDKTYNNGAEKKGDIKTAALALGGITVSKLLFAPIDGRDTTHQFVERTSKNILQSYETSLRSGYLFGQNTDDINKQIDNKMKQVARGMQSGIRTAVPSYAKTTDRIIFLNNDVEVVYCAILDGRTCIVCGSNHGLRYKSITEAPSIPQHANCRCIYLKASDVTEPMPTYEEFVDNLSEEEQKHILGKNRYELRKKYNIPLDKFINNGRKLRLEEVNYPDAIVKNVSSNNSGARSKIIEILNTEDAIEQQDEATKYYEKIRSSDNKGYITRIANNSGKSYKEIEQIVNHIFNEKHHFIDGSYDYFYPSSDIIKALERIKTNEHTDTDILLLNHELAELTYIKNKKYNVYEIAHDMANKKYNWEEVITNENVSKNK